MKVYLVKEDFWIGEINKGLKTGETVEYDDTKGILKISEKSYEVKNLKAAIKAEWLEPLDGKLPVLDGPIGETAEEASERKRKERFAALAKLDKDNKITKDAREISRVGGVFEEGTPEYYDAMGIEKNPQKKGKFKTEVIEDDTKIVATIHKNEEIKELKKARNPEPKGKKKILEVVKDHHNDGMVEVGKYVDDNKEHTIKTWGQLHWTKKADVIKTAGKEFLTQIKEVESSAKIIDRIDTRLQEL